MKKNIFFLVLFNLMCLVGNFSPAGCLFDGMSLCAQELVAKNCELSLDNPYAEQHPRSWEDVPCAVLIIKTPQIEGLTFPNKAQRVGDVEYKDGNYYVYMVQGAYRLEVRHHNFQPLDINLKDSFGIRVKSSKTYVLELDQVMSSSDDRKCVAQFKIVPTVFGQVEFDGQIKKIPDNGIVEFAHAPGSFKYIVSADNYKSETGTVILNSGTEAVSVRLRPETVPVVISCNVGNATVFVDNVSYGKPGRIMLPKGVHEVSVRANKYLDKNQTVLITSSLSTLSFNLEKNQGQTTVINPTPIRIYSNSIHLYKNNKEIKGWSDGAVVYFMPGVKCRLSDDDDNHCIFAAGTTPKSYNFVYGRMEERTSE